MARLIAAVNDVARAEAARLNQLDAAAETGDDA